MIQPTSAPIRATTQEFLEVEDIADDLVIMTSGSAAIVIETTAVNFGLLSEDEQDALIYAYASFLNSLSFPLQIVILSKRMDISSYIEYLVDKEHKTADTIYKDRIKNYREFIMSTVKDNKVLEKKFYLVVPFSVLEMGIKNSLSSTGKKKKLPFSKDYIISRAKTSLFPKRDHILRQLGRIGLKGRQLTTQELVELFYSLYNPSFAGGKLGESTGYIKPLVEGA
ncbi:hypothetical protein A3D05_02310 [Candidatus Gottesmanbacteria bacterium RIFCSPHIGHO2_02_FULL_40_24]|uniref:TraC-like domain-containing protein n=1 Tax=Candidatus Gottesmanbacteria bacterium RIFCSPHIGHO2_01_FULL_40_15 TaxID=1798376 RepID=A0A1F5Z3Q4_9BACT|nr:MAG: hypothetical protein A2777_03945 [Candidatus Gottesmanbacteria bacterium RIFCSPHIGHO2_01_FULL_40_15]OGG18684.1 MAG: hypothetical protein A3D05_02310 [Candidatus Gottesmanbacteria bacterium RIFCSPHIGHO2_02_FULL_40_24]OGG22976.1 MAG: hypothetical protein A3E42_06515 [Candidatus Gottesmanbacteria bacterium RIFCSPHIGHO2_12_FULL_40_13]OGG31894.1 MAG: hypothetical protein A3I80_02650 [Candidatus Gottesmanbacteria bacterium RIFCSPLOWO2_02_FULL_40_10]